MSKFAIGDVVMLKSGGRRMAVTREVSAPSVGGIMFTLDDEYYEVIWFSAEGNLQKATIGGAVLTKTTLDQNTDPDES